MIGDRYEERYEGLKVRYHPCVAAVLAAEWARKKPPAK